VEEKEQPTLTEASLGGQTPLKGADKVTPTPFPFLPVRDHLWPRRATFFPPRTDHLFSVDHLFSTVYRDLGPPEIFGWWPPCLFLFYMIRLCATVYYIFLPITCITCT